MAATSRGVKFLNQGLKLSERMLYTTQDSAKKVSSDHPHQLAVSKLRYPINLTELCYSLPFRW